MFGTMSISHETFSITTFICSSCYCVASRRPSQLSMRERQSQNLKHPVECSAILYFSASVQPQLALAAHSLYSFVTLVLAYRMSKLSGTHNNQTWRTRRELRERSWQSQLLLCISWHPSVCVLRFSSSSMSFRYLNANELLYVFFLYN